MMRRLAGVVAAVASVLCVALPAHADERSDLVQQQKDQQAQVEKYQSSLEGVDTSLQTVYLQLQQTQAKIPAAKAELVDAQSELAAATRKQESVAAQLQAAQAELASITDEVTAGEAQTTLNQAELGAIARAQYRGDTIPSTWDLLAGSKSSDDFLNAVAAQRTALRQQSAALTAIKQKTAEAKNRQARQSAVEDTISSLKAEADQLVSEKADKEAAATAKANELSKLEATYTSQSKALEAKKAAFQASIAAAAAEEQETAAKIAAIDEANRKAAAAAAAAAASAARAAQGSGNAAADSGSTSYSGFIIPVVKGSLYVTSPFGMRNYPFGGYYMHNGVDLRSSCGAEQVASGNGTVTAVIPAEGNSTHGNQIFLNLGIVNGHSWVVVTNHLSGFNVSVGQTVKKGDVIGWTGQTGKVTACHAHMEVWRDGQVINPMSLF